MVTDGGAIVLSLVMIAVVVRFRAPWAQRRAAAPRHVVVSSNP
ncbi:hypothetical protein AB0I53_09150 [Saccharopolyspora sp. NPDC050389]